MGAQAVHLLVVGEVLILGIERLLKILGLGLGVGHVRLGLGTRLDNVRFREAAANLDKAL